MIIPTRFSLRLLASVGTFLLPAALASAAGSAAAAQRLALTSSAFAEAGMIPNAYAYRDCAPGALNRSPALSWRGVPAGTKSFAVTLFDPDAPTGHGFWHWVLFNVSPRAQHIAAGGGDPRSASALPGATAGHNDFGASKYGGPCPPPGSKAHHYVFTVLALDIAAIPGGSSATTGPALLSAISGHVLAEGKLIGRFGR